MVEDEAKEREGDEKELAGSEAYRNWLKALEGVPLNSCLEFNLYSDAHITGTVIEECGSYQFLNTVPTPSPIVANRPSVVLRADFHLDSSDHPSMEETHDEFYHGGWIADELAALLSLCMGIRVKAGDIIRDFSPGGDPKGHPRTETPESIPYLPPQRQRDPTLPGKTKTHNLNNSIALLTQYPTLSPANAIALVRSARFYQEAIWIAEGAPELSWLLLVSAMETAAFKWYQDNFESPADLLRDLEPELASMLKEAGGQELLKEVAEQLAHSMGATKKFLKFARRFHPPPPPARPNEHHQHRWSKTALGKSLYKIYNYRSEALHGGKPFPVPMCYPPFQHSEEEAPNEIPMGSAMSASGGTWVREDTPLLLHVFEYFVRNALLKWWEYMVEEATTEQPTSEE